APFFVEVAYTAVHFPFQPPDRPSDALRDHGTLVQKPDDSRPATRRDYVAMLERADRGIGEILRVLDNRGLSNNTLVIFTNDNGGEWLSRNAPFFHRKGTLWEGGIRVPCILRWPGHLSAGKTSEQPGITMDLTTTILAATNTPLPAAYQPDGLDLLPILRGESLPVERSLYWRINREDRKQKAVRAGKWKYVVDGGHHLLFDLHRDLGEHHDLAARYPAMVRRLKASLAVWEKDVDQREKPAQ
ncbi:MAG: sulfatase-like hydrolase/transferase, partial [Blastocatellia bacterium]